MQEAIDMAEKETLMDLCQMSASLRDEKHNIITFSPKVETEIHRA